MGIRNWQAYIFILPAVLLFTVFSFIPMIQGVVFSFYKMSLKESVFIGFGNYIKLFNDPYFWVELKNTFIFVGIIVTLNYVLALGIALMIDKLKGKLQALFRGMFYLPAVSAGVVMSIVWLWIFNQNAGPINYFLSLVGINKVLWLSSPGWARMSVSIVALNWIVGLNIILFLSSLGAIPRQIYESADVEGAGAIQKFFHITLPLISPISVYILITTTIGVFQIWAAIYLLTAGGPVFSTTSIVYRIYQLGFMYHRFGEASAHATILLGIIFSIAFMQFKYLNKKLEY